ncbi:hypothetical protein IRJ41_000445, partial [Triplophysa rosa]
QVGHFEQQPASRDMDKLIHLILLSGLVCIPGSLADEYLATPGPVHSQKCGERVSDRQATVQGRTLELISTEEENIAVVSSQGFYSFYLPKARQGEGERARPRTNRRARPAYHQGYLRCVKMGCAALVKFSSFTGANKKNTERCAVTPDPLPGNTVSLSCGVMEGRYVNVILSGRTSYLTLCEVEVYETENLAVKGAVTQSSTYLTWTPQHAIDGVRYGPDPDDVPYCSHTTSQSNPWWRLDLLDVCDISTVIITARSDCCVAQINGAEIRIGNSLVNNGNNNPICAVTSGVLAGHTISYSCYGMEGRYVNVVMTGRTSPLTLCEVEVYGKCHRKKYFLRLKFSSSGDVAAESDKILHQLQSALASHISDFNLSWTQLPEEEEKPRADRGSCVKHL